MVDFSFGDEVRAPDGRGGRAVGEDSHAYQEQLLRQMSAEDPRPFVMGGFGEDAVLHHRSTRPHSDIDWFTTRDQLDRSSEIAGRLGLPTMGVYGRTATGDPFYVAWTKDESFWLECVVADRGADGALYIELAELNFDTTGLPPLAPFRIQLPPDTVSYPPSPFEDFEVQTVSPLALYQIRTGLNRFETFGPLRDKDILAAQQLRERFFPDATDHELAPRIELL